MGYISLELLDKNNAVNVPEKEGKSTEKCEHLSHFMIECNVGGFANLECTSPAYHNVCPFKMKYIDFIRNRKKNI
jgi:hypothetical protein